MGEKIMIVMKQMRSNRNLVLFSLMLILGIAGATWAIMMSPLTPASPKYIKNISQNTLEETYGLRVSLVAVTAAGGMVDVRLKIVDGEKASRLLGDKANFPALLAADGVTQLNVDEDTRSQKVQLDANGGLYLMFPNAGNAVKQGARVTIFFGDTRLEPILVR
jgi:hypothetical protein